MASNYMTKTSSEAYAKYRPSPPDVYLDTVLAYVKEKIHGPLKNALDVGCGTGQCTLFLSPHFQHVLGLDVNDSQVEEAKKSAEHLPNVEFGASGAESLPVESGTIHLLTAASCLHYFDVDKFYAEAKRVLTPDGVIAVSTVLIPAIRCGDSSLDQKIAQHFAEYYQFIHKGVEDPGFHLVLERYNPVKLPFNDTRRIDGIWTVCKCSVAYVRFYLASWCAFQITAKKQGKEVCEKHLSELIEKIMKILQSAKSEEETAVELHFEYVILLGCMSQ